MIVREEPDSFALVKQHDHGRISGEFAARWREKPRPLEPTLYAVANHDVAWQKLDRRVLWNEEKDKPYSFMDYPTVFKLRAYKEGLNLLESKEPYAACLCSMHYVTILGGAEGEAGVRFKEAEFARQQGLKGAMAAVELDNLEHNLHFLKLCDGLSLFVCLNKPGETDYPPPTPNGFELAGERFEPVWEDRSTLRLVPSPFSESFDLIVPYSLVQRNGRPAGSGSHELRVTC